MRWYLAARFGRRDELKQHRELLRSNGHEVNARWLDLETDMTAPTSTEEKRINDAIMDAEDVSKCDGVLSFTEDPDNPNIVGRGRGGRHVEFGMALALNKRVVVIGPKENIFHWLPNVEVYEDLETFLDEEAMR